MSDEPKRRTVVAFCRGESEDPRDAVGLLQELLATYDVRSVFIGVVRVDDSGVHITDQIFGHMNFVEGAALSLLLHERCFDR